jgi:hypothetical protein
MKMVLLRKELRESPTPYAGILETENEGLRFENGCFCDNTL